MDCIITIKKKPKLLQDYFVRSKAYHFKNDRITIGNEESDCALAGYSGLPARIVRQGGIHYFFFPPANDSKFLINNEIVQEKQLLHSGDSMIYGEAQMYFYLHYDKVGIAASSKLLSLFTKIAVTSVLIIQFLFIFFLISWFQKSPIWNNQLTRLTVIHKIDTLRYIYKRPKKFTAQLNKTLANEIYQDITEQARFIRQNSAILTPDQMKVILADLEQYRKYYYWLSSPKNQQSIPEIQLNQAVKNVIQKNIPK